jgi:ribosomal protein S19
MLLDICLNRDLLTLLKADKQKNMISYLLHSRLLFDKFFINKHFYYIILDPSKFVSFNIYLKSNTVLSYFKYTLVRLYRGYKWKSFYITNLVTGFKFGNFCKTKSRFVFRSKTLKKKLKSKKINALQTIKIKKIKLLKASKTKKQRTISKSGLSISY